MEGQSSIYQPLQNGYPRGPVEDEKITSRKEARIEYKVECFHRSWVHSKTPEQRYEFGFWIRKTIDRVLPPQLHGNADKVIWRSLNQGEIRLMRLFPGEPHTPLEGLLEITSLTASGCPTGYEALSYCWGEPKITATITLNGQSVKINQNLEAALRHLRYTDVPRFLWIDALCINQANCEEKGDQVEKMLDIYGAANGVFAWLGLETEATAAGMMVLKDLITGQSNYNMQPSWMSLPPDLVGSGLNDIVSRSYFTRIWIVQETAIAREVVLVCGSHSVGWMNNIDTVWPFMRRLKAAVISPQWRASGTEKLDLDLLIELLQMQLDTGPESLKWQQTKPAPDLLDVSYESRNKLASDPRDKYFALRRLANRTGDEGIRPDYSLSVEDVWNKFGQRYLGEASSFERNLTREEKIDSDLQDSNTQKAAANTSEKHHQMPYSRMEEEQKQQHLEQHLEHMMETFHSPTSSNNLSTSTLDEKTPFELGLDEQSEIILNYVEATMHRTKRLISEGHLGKSACLVEQLARDLRSCADSWE